MAVCAIDGWMLAMMSQSRGRQCYPMYWVCPKSGYPMLLFLLGVVTIFPIKLFDGIPQALDKTIYKCIYIYIAASKSGKLRKMQTWQTIATNPYVEINYFVSWAHGFSPCIAEPYRMFKRCSVLLGNMFHGNITISFLNQFPSVLELHRYTVLKKQLAKSTIWSISGCICNPFVSICDHIGHGLWYFITGCSRLSSNNNIVQQ